VLLLFLGLGAFPWGWLRGPVERRLSGLVGKPATVGSIERLDYFSFHPRLLVRDIRVPEPAWAGSGELATVRALRVRFAVLPLLAGRFRPEELRVEGARLRLVRTRDGRKSWTRNTGGGDGGSGSGPGLGELTVADSRIIYLDARRDRSFDLAFASDALGLRADGRGMIRGAPVTVRVRAAPVSVDGRWPFIAGIDGREVGMVAEGAMDRPLDFGHFDARIRAHGNDLKMVDAIIEAGLFGTQPVRLAADVRRDRPLWKIRALTGTIGRSDIDGQAVIAKRNGRTRIDGSIRSRNFDFDDLTSDEGRRKAAAERARLGPRILPGTRINLTKLARTDGRLEVRADRLLWSDPLPLRALSATLVLDHSRLTVEPLTFTLPHGTLSGRMQSDQRGGRTTPVLDADLRIEDGRATDFFPNGAVDAVLTGHIRLQGPGDTIRAALGKSGGSIGLVARDGVIPARMAAILGADVGRAITTDKDKLATLRCAVARFDVKDGVARANPFIIDTSRSKMVARGTVRLSDERLFLDLHGAPKKDSILRLKGDAHIRGTIEAPVIEVPDAEGTGGVGGAIKAFAGMTGRWISGKQPPLATDADCAALAARALR
jgi:uncharacterized protein involved in outer membrane biogenesis